MAVGAPSGTVTFLFTDIEGSTRLWSEAPDAMKAALERHDAILNEEIDRRGGYVFATGGDGLAAGFARAADAAAAAVGAQERLRSECWPQGVLVRVRMGMHTGEAAERAGDYFGAPVNEAARLMAIANGGQVLCSAVTAALLPPERTIIDLGEHRLRDLTLARRVFQLGEGEFPALRSLNAYRTNLPVQPSRFVGRDEELGRVAAALAQSRLVTLTGVGGVGKTRLALQAAADALPSFPDGVWLVELGGLIDPEMVGETVAGVLGVPSVLGRPGQQALLDAVAMRELLVVLDNCEHLIDAAAEVAEELVSASEKCKVLATSREGLAVRGERVVPVPPMSVAGDGALSADAVKLFVERAAEARDGFVATDQDGEVLVALCRRLDGIPLALELAAARVRSMAPDEILSHLDQRFRLLSAGRRTAPTRQQTLRGAIDWSYSLLDETERVLLRRIAVFATGFDLDAVEAVVTDPAIGRLEVVSLVDRLVDKSLLVAESQVGATRYRLLETVRDYGLERLEEAGETMAFARHHAEYYAELSERAGRGLRGPDEAAWDQTVEAELENLRAALRWAIAADEADLAVRLVAGLAVAGPRMGIPFGADAADAARLSGAFDHPLRPLCLASAAWSASLRGDFDDGLPLSLESLEHHTAGDLRDPEPLRARSEALTVATSVRAIRGETGALMAQLRDEGLRVATQLGDPYYLAHALMHHVSYDPSTGDEVIRQARACANPSTLAYGLAIVAGQFAADQPARAKELLDEAIEHATAVRNEQAGALARQGLALLVLRSGGDPIAAATTALDSAERLLGTAERFFGFSLLAVVAIGLEMLGADDAACVVAAWLASRRFDFSATTVMVNQRRANRLFELAEPRLHDLEPRVAAMTDADVVTLCRTAIAAASTDG
jgi:predicted ATPase/class 3 adenylate cyclase